jgi:hypothetical protein
VVWAGIEMDCSICRRCDDANVVALPQVTLELMHLSSYRALEYMREVHLNHCHSLAEIQQSLSRKRHA